MSDITTLPTVEVVADFPESQGPAGVVPLSARDNGYNEQVALVKSLLGKAKVATLVQVMAVNPTAKTVDVLPLVTQIDGNGRAVDQAICYNISYSRIQAGNSAIIIDPKVNDIGLCVFCHNDISGVKKSKSISLPGSNRRNDWADGIYLFSVLGNEPTQIIEFTDDGINITSPKTTFTGEVWANGHRIDQSHTHGGVQTGSGTTGAVT